MEKLRTYLNALTVKQQIAFAKKCKTSRGHLRNIINRSATCAEKLAIDLERESAGFIPVEETREDVDWAYIRGTAKRRTTLKLAGKTGRKRAYTVVAKRKALAGAQGLSGF